MTAGTITLETMRERHCDDAARLSREAGWPHRREDWALVLSVSEGIVAVEDEAVVGTALATLFDDTTAAISMVIVDAAMRGRGLGRRLMEAAFERTGGRDCLLVATQEGLPLYEKLGFSAAGEIVQHQGITGAAKAPEGVEWAQAGDLDRIAVLDASARGFARRAVVAALDGAARFAVVRDGGRVEAFAAIRPFGRGTVVGPIVARTHDEALSLLDFLLAGEGGSFVRVDTDVSSGLGPELVRRGLPRAGGGITMRRGRPAPQADTSHRVFALVNQALG